MSEFHLYMLQRISALIMIPLTLGHIGLMIYAVQDGLTTAEILGRTQGSVFWGLFYGLFVVAVAVHAAIGLRVIARETINLRGSMLSVFTIATGLLLLVLGMRAVAMVVLP